jgi:hypothetical protein
VTHSEPRAGRDYVVKTLADLDRLTFERAKARNAILVAGERPLIIPSRDGWTLVIHSDTYAHRLGGWRITRLDGDEPTAEYSQARDL